MTITIHSQTYTFAELPELIIQKQKLQLAEWEAAFFDFLQNWFDQSETIIAQTSGSTGEPKKILLSKESMKK